MRLTPQNSFQNLVLLNERTSTVLGSEKFRYGFNKMEADDEIKGSRNSYDFGARIYDSRLGRFLSLDPMSKNFPFQSPYLFASNNPIFYIDENGEYSVATHFTVTYNAAIKVGFSHELATKIAHYASVYADHPDWNYMSGAMHRLNQMEMSEQGMDQEELEYNSDKYGSYKTTEWSQASTMISSVSIHAMKTYWENISDEEAVDRALYGGTFTGKEGQHVVIEGAYNVIERLQSLNLQEKDWTEDQLKDLGLALHTIQDAQVHEGARWVTPGVEKAAEDLGHKNEHPNICCVVEKCGLDDAIEDTEMRLKMVKGAEGNSKIAADYDESDE